MSAVYEKLKEVVDSIQDDLEKAERGNKAATTRVRKTMQDVKALAQDLRKEMMDIRNAS